MCEHNRQMMISINMTSEMYVKNEVGDLVCDFSGSDTLDETDVLTVCAECGKVMSELSGVQISEWVDNAMFSLVK